MSTIMQNNTDTNNSALKQSPIEISTSPTPLNPLSGNNLYSNNKYGVPIPNRIFVGGLPSSTNEQELKAFFSTYGPVKDAKIIHDRSGLSKGIYGFVTFELQETAEKIIKSESESLIFKERKLNIGPAIRKQPTFTRSDMSNTILLANGTMPYALQNGMTIFPAFGGQEYSILPQGGNYAQVMLPQPMYLPQTQYALPGPTFSTLTTNSNGQLTAVPANFDQWTTSGPSAAGMQTSNQILNGSNQANHVNNYQTNPNQQAWRYANPQQITTQTATIPNTFMYNGYPNNASEVMYIQQQPTASFAPNSTSDYSTDTSTQSMFDGNDHENSPRRSNQDAILCNNSPDHLLQMSANSNAHKLFTANPSLGPTALFGHQILPGNASNLKPGMSPYTVTRVLPATPAMLNHNARNGLGKDDLRPHILHNANYNDGMAMSAHY